MAATTTALARRQRPFGFTAFGALMLLMVQYTPHVKCFAIHMQPQTSTRGGQVFRQRHHRTSPRHNKQTWLLKRQAIGGAVEQQQQQQPESQQQPNGPDVSNGADESHAELATSKQQQQQQQQIASANNNNENDTSSRVWPCFDELDRRLFKIALPVIANFAILPLVGAVDLFWVNRMGNALAVAGQAAANQVFSSAFWITSFLPSVTATLISKENAKKNQSGVQDAVAQALFVGMFMAAVTNLLLFLNPAKVLGSVLASGAPALEYARPYLLIRSFAFLPSLISLVGFSAFRGVLDTVTPVKISLFANVFNAVLDPILIFGAGMGVTGAAVATLTAEVISAITYLVVLHKRNILQFSKLFALPSWKRLEPLLKGGAALQTRNVALNLTFLTVARVTQGIDKAGIAAAAHAMTIQVFQLGGIVLLAMSTVAQTMVPNDLQRVYDEAKRKMVGGIRTAKNTVNRLMSWGLLLGVGLGMLQLLALPLIRQSTPLQEVRDAARIPSILACIMQAMNGLVFIGEGIMVGTGSFIELSLSTVVATAGCLWALHTLPAIHGLTGVWMSFGVFNVLRLIGVALHQRVYGPLSPRRVEKQDPAAA